MNQANVGTVVSKLRFNVKPRRKLKNIDGEVGRLRKISKTLTAAIKYERIELYYPRADETRGYIERLISEAIRYGPTHKETMDLADFWIQEKQLIHKLFKVLVPRYQDYTSSYTKLHKAPNIYPGYNRSRAILELKGNIYPSIEQCNPHERNLIHNVLLDAAKREFRLTKYKELAENLQESE